MRWLTQAATLLAASAPAWAIPTKNYSFLPIEKSAVAGSTDLNGPSVLFSIPCQGCFPDTDEELDIEIKIEPSSIACNSPSIILNEVRLFAEPAANAVNTILFKANTVNTPSVQDVVAHWTMTCINNEITLLTVTVDEVLRQSQIPPRSGFSASFRQTSSPEVLRVERAPADDATSPPTLQHWTQVQDNPEYTLLAAPATIDEALPDKFKEELRRLHEIKAHIGRLHHKYMRQEHRVFDMIKHDFSACHGPSCIFQTAIAKAPEFLELLKAHFKHSPDWSKIHGSNDPPFGIHKQGDSTIIYGGHEKPHDHSSSSEDVMPETTPYPLPFDEPEPDFLPPSPPSNGDDVHLSSWGTDENHPPPPPPLPLSPQHHNQTRHNHTGRPPWAGHRGPGHHGPGDHRPHFFHRHGPHRHPFFFSIGSIIFFVAAAGLLFKCVRVKTGLFRNVKRQRDRAARQEETRSRAAYRRAARQHRWVRWWSQFRRPQSTSDYEEKRARILGQEDALEDVMQTEIQDIRRAHEIVGDMMRAEEGRHRMYHEANFGSTSQPASPSYGLHRQNTEISSVTDSDLPLYQPPPPSYEHELEGDMMVVDGFSYTPSGTEGTPESSVVDCNSRMSFETENTVTYY